MRQIGCPECRKGKVYPLAEPKRLVRIVGRPPLQATVYEFHALRCNLCGEEFTPPTPATMPEKYDATAVSMIAVLKYGSGVPWYRLQGLESHLAIPLPVSVVVYPCPCGRATLPDGAPARSREKWPGWVR